MMSDSTSYIVKFFFFFRLFTSFRKNKSPCNTLDKCVYTYLKRMCTYMPILYYSDRD